NLAVVHVEHERDDHVPVAREPLGAVEFLPISHVKARVIETRMVDVSRQLRRPRREIHGELIADHYRLAVKRVRAARYRHPQAIDLQPVQTLQAVVYDPILLPSHQPVSRGSVEEVMFPGALPDEVPGVLGVHADGPAPAAVIGVESPLERLLEVALPVHYGITVIARFGRHETDAV